LGKLNFLDASEIGFPQNFPAAFALLSKVVKQDDSPLRKAEAREYLADMYYHGKGTKRHFGKALELLKISAIQDNVPKSQVLLGKIYMIGENGVKQDKDMAFKLFSLAANQDSDERAKAGATYILSLLHMSTETMPEKYDIKKAHELLTRSAEQDLLVETKAEAKKMLDKIDQTKPKKKKKKGKKVPQAAAAQP
jgi:TPR repeat protein